MPAETHEEIEHINPKGLHEDLDREVGLEDVHRKWTSNSDAILCHPVIVPAVRHEEIDRLVKSYSATLVENV